eukprot:8847565-Pyramimonas_sp.AAC.1
MTLLPWYNPSLPPRPLHFAVQCRSVGLCNLQWVGGELPQPRAKQDPFADQQLTIAARDRNGKRSL